MASSPPVAPPASPPLSLVRPAKFEEKAFLKDLVHLKDTQEAIQVGHGMNWSPSFVSPWLYVGTYPIFSGPERLVPPQPQGRHQDDEVLGKGHAEGQVRAEISAVLSLQRHRAGKAVGFSYVELFDFNFIYHSIASARKQPTSCPSVRQSSKTPWSLSGRKRRSKRKSKGKNIHCLF